MDSTTESPTSTPKTPIVAGGDIVYQDQGICIADANGEFVKKLPYKAFEGEPVAISSQGQLAYSQPDSKDSSICLVSGKDAEPVKLTHGHFDHGPNFSADSNVLYFTRTDTAGGSRHLCLINLSDRKAKPLTSGYDDSWPAVSPDGKTIIFCRKPLSGNGTAATLWKISAKGSKPIEITPKGFNSVTSCSWSAKGDKIYFSGKDSRGNDSIFWIPAKGGSEAVQLTNSRDLSCNAPSSTSDDSVILFNAVPVEQGVEHIGRVDADGSNFQAFIAEPSAESHRGVCYPVYVK